MMRARKPLTPPLQPQHCVAASPHIGAHKKMQTRCVKGRRRGALEAAAGPKTSATTKGERARRGGQEAAPGGLFSVVVGGCFGCGGGCERVREPAEGRLAARARALWLLGKSAQAEAKAAQAPIVC